MLRAVRVLVSLVVLGTAAACGDDGGARHDAASDGPDSDLRCQPQGATGQFIRRAGNPRLLPRQDFPDGMIDIHIADPDVRWSAATQRWDVYFGALHGTSYASGDLVPIIRRASSADRMTWTVDDEPSLRAATDATAWDHTHTEAPTVIMNPAAPPDRRYLMLYAGASEVFPHPGYTFAHSQIGAAFSADGRAFTRIPASLSPHGEEGLVLTGKQVHPTAVDAIVADPEVVLVDGIYHLFFSSFSCGGTNCATIETTGIGHATSADGITWTVAEAPVRSLLRASADLKTGGAQPSVVYDVSHCRWEMWFTSDLAGDVNSQPVAFNNMAGVWHATSTDGNAWSVNFVFARELAWMASEPGEELGLRGGADVGDSGSGRLMLYVGFDDDDVPTGFTLPLRAGGTTPGVSALNVATRDLP